MDAYILSIILRRVIIIGRIVQIIEFFLCIAFVIATTFWPVHFTVFVKYTIHKEREESLFCDRMEPNKKKW